MSYSKNSPFYISIGEDLSLRLGESRISTWTTADRPTGSNEMFGYNKELQQLEIYFNGQWHAIVVEGGDPDEAALRYSFMMH